MILIRAGVTTRGSFPDCKSRKLPEPLLPGVCPLHWVHAMKGRSFP